MARIIVYHSHYGCETGCCGHTIEVDGEEKFFFEHPGHKEDFRAFAEEMVRDHFGEEHVKDLDWENCRIVTEC